MDQKKVIIKGHTVAYDSTVSQGVRYLTYELDEQEAKVFFNEAYDHGSAVFEDHMGSKFKLLHSVGGYQLVKP